DRWRLCWILPVTGTESRVPGRAMARAQTHDSVGHRIGAPTPTDERLDLPARLVGTFPVEESRSRIAPGPLTDLLIAAAADAYADLVLAVPAADRLALIPPGGFPL